MNSCTELASLRALAVWEWAGEIRNRAVNIGVDAYKIRIPS